MCLVYSMPILMAQENSWEFYSLQNYLLKERETNNNYIVVLGGLYIWLCATQVLQVQLENKRAGAELAEIGSY